MNWNDLTILLAVSRSATLSEAARRLSVAQTTVSRRLDALEEALGVQLVERRRDGVRLTEDGLDAVRSAEQMEGLAFELERSLLGGSDRLSGRLRITAPDMISTYHADLFTGFAMRYPNIELEVSTGYAVRSLARREADVAVRLTARPVGSLFGRKLGRVEYAIYATRELVEEHGADCRLEQFPWLGWTEAAGAKVTERWMKREVPGARVVVRCDTALALHAALRTGAGVGFAPCAYADPDPRLVRLHGPIPEFGYDIWCLTHIDLSTTARVRAFLRTAGEYFADWKDRLAGVAEE